MQPVPPESRVEAPAPPSTPTPQLCLVGLGLPGGKQQPRGGRHGCRAKRELEGWAPEGGGGASCGNSQASVWTHAPSQRLGARLTPEARPHGVTLAPAAAAAADGIAPPSIARPREVPSPLSHGWGAPLPPGMHQGSPARERAHAVQRALLACPGLFRLFSRT